MKKLMLLVAMLAMVVTMVAVAAPVTGQEMKMEEKEKMKMEEEKKKEKEKMKEMPKTGGIPVDTAVLGLAAGALLVGGGLLVRKAVR